MIRNKALETMSLIAKGKGVIAYVTQEMLKETGARMDETDTVVQDCLLYTSTDEAVRGLYGIQTKARALSNCFL